MLKIAWHPLYHHPLAPGHRFPMEKYSLLPEQLLYEGTINSANIFQPEAISEYNLLLTHESDYWQKLKQLQLNKIEERRTGFPLTAQLVERERVIMQGTLAAAHFALEYGIAMNVAGGTHHAYSYRGEGFCLLNDMAIAANCLLHEKRIERALIIDLDVHQGNGTAQIFANDPRVFTFSMHGEKNYPHPKEKSDLDIGLPDNCSDEYYLNMLQNELPKLFELVEPDIAFYQCGVDILSSDKLGRIGISENGCKERDRFVLEQCKLNGVPVVCSMGGGYSEKISVIVNAHANTFRLAQEMFF